MRSAFLVLVCGFAALAAGGCSDDTAGPHAGSNFSPHYAPQYRTITDAAKLIIAAPASSATVWETIGASNSGSSTAPKAGFTAPEGVVAALGQCERAGYRM